MPHPKKEPNKNLKINVAFYRYYARYNNQLHISPRTCARNISNNNSLTNTHTFLNSQIFVIIKTVCDKTFHNNNTDIKYT